MGDEITLKIRRFAPQHDSSSHFDLFSIPRSVAEGMTIVSALDYIQENLDPSLAFYYSCELGKCRSCLMDVNGKATFACTEPVADGQVIEPLAHLPVIRDLVVKFMLSDVAIDDDKCTGCGACVEACPMDIFEMADASGMARLRDGVIDGFDGIGDRVDCIGCFRCREACPVEAIEVIRSECLPGPAEDKGEKG